MSRIVAQHVGLPREIPHGDGVWRSAIFRTPVDGPVELGLRGLAGDAVADTKHHGGPGQAVSCQPLAHYAHWNAHFGATLGPGSVGENWTVAEWTEGDVCVGDIWAVGSARVQVSAPRYPCYKQERRTGLPGFHERVLESRRTGWYLRVLGQGSVSAGDAIVLEARPHPWLTLEEANRAALGPAFDPEQIERHLAVPELPDGWKQILERRQP